LTLRAGVRIEQASLEGARAFRMEVGVRFGTGAAGAAFGVFWEFSAEGDGRFLAGLVRIVMRGGEGTSGIDGKEVF
jgi:hypothetical protein